MKSSIASVLLGAIVLIAGCDDSAAPITDKRPVSEDERPSAEGVQLLSEDKRPLPDGWSRVQFREGYVSRDNTHSFTVDLPPGWSVGESWSGYSGPTGWILGRNEDGRDLAPAVRFSLGTAQVRSLDNLRASDNIVVTQPLVEDQTAILYLAKEFAVNLGPQVGVFYRHIPGAPEGIVAPSLTVDGDSRGFVDPDLLGRVLTSIRYRVFDEFQKLPEHVMSPESDWKRTPARTDYPTFSVMLPTGWKIKERKGIDSLVGELAGDGIRLNYDFGSFGGTPFSPDWAAQEGRYAPHRIWEEKIGDIEFSFARPLSPSPERNGTTGVFAELRGQSGKESKSVTVHGFQAGPPAEWVGLTEAQQEIALAIFRSIEFE